MNRQEVQHHFRRQNIKHHQFAQRKIAKTSMNIRQRKTTLHNSSHNNYSPRSKNLQLKCQQNNQNLFPSSSQPIILSQCQIISSSPYKNLQQQLKFLQKNHISQIQQLNEMKIYKGQEITKVKKQLYQIRLDIWQLRDQHMELREILETQRQNYQRLLQLMEAQDQQFQHLGQNHVEQLQQSNLGLIQQQNLGLAQQQNLHQVQQQEQQHSSISDKTQ